MLSAVQFMAPTLRRNIPLAWRLLKTWSKHELPIRAVPWYIWYAMATLGFFENFLCDFFLCAGKLFAVRRSQVDFSKAFILRGCWRGILQQSAP